jgi:hypothetical protein
MMQRHGFESTAELFSNHFILSVLFRCLHDKIEPFLTEATFQLDANLPAIDEEEVRAVETELAAFLKQANAVGNKQQTSSSSSGSFSASSSSAASSSSSSGNGLVTTSSPVSADKQPKTPPMESVMEEELAKSGEVTTAAVTTTNAVTSGDSSSSNFSFILKELNVFTQSQSRSNHESQGDLNKSTDNDLLVLNKLNELLALNQDKLLSLSDSNQNNFTSDKISNSQNNQPEVVEGLVSETVAERDLVKRTVRELKEKINETKSYVREYQSEISAYLTQLAAQTEHVATTAAVKTTTTITEEKSTVTSTIVETNEIRESQNKVDYARLLGVLEEAGGQDDIVNALAEQMSQLAGSGNEDERRFLVVVVELMRQWRGAHLKELDELRAGMQAVKVSMNADRQIMFNEAIKRATKDKDRVIDELRLKQDEFVGRVAQLEAELKQYQQQQQQQQATAEVLASVPVTPALVINTVSFFFYSIIFCSGFLKFMNPWTLFLQF